MDVEHGKSIVKYWIFDVFLLEKRCLNSSEQKCKGDLFFDFWEVWLFLFDVCLMKWQRIIQGNAY